MASEIRIEKDSMGEMSVPADLPPGLYQSLRFINHAALPSQQALLCSIPSLRYACRAMVVGQLPSPNRPINSSTDHT